MPAHPLWLDRLAALQAQVADDSAPVWWDRVAIEQLFGLRCRQAISLLHQMGAGWIGTHLVMSVRPCGAFCRSRAAALRIKKNKRGLPGPPPPWDNYGANKTPGQIAIPLPAAPERLDSVDLPAGIDLQRQQLTIAYESAAELLEKLAALAHALILDFGTFEAKLQSPESAL